MNDQHIEKLLQEKPRKTPSAFHDQSMDRIFNEAKAREPASRAPLFRWRIPFWQTALACTGCMMLGLWLGRLGDNSLRAGEDVPPSNLQPSQGIEVHISPEDALAMIQSIDLPDQEGPPPGQ